MLRLREFSCKVVAYIAYPLSDSSTLEGIAGGDSWSLQRSRSLAEFLELAGGG